MVIIIFQDGECIGLSSIVDLIHIDKMTAFPLIFDKHFVYSGKMGLELD